MIVRRFYAIDAVTYAEDDAVGSISESGFHRNVET